MGRTRLENFAEIERKWQKYYAKNKIFEAQNSSKKRKYFYLVEFPYPSGDGLHVGHIRGYTALDIMARKKRMERYNVLFPMGWDAFGEAAEGYAIKHKIHPKEAVEQNVATFREQCKRMGFSFDWSREFSTTDPEYVKWTQWQFLKFFKNGLAYKAPAKVNWCPNCKITKSNEEAAGGVCDRCNSPVEEREKEQWIIKMSDYAQSLLDGLEDTNFQDQVKLAQINWIGKLNGAIIQFNIKQKTYEKLAIFTTRPDTIFGVSSIQIAWNHPFIKDNIDKIQNIDEIKNYIKTIEEKTKKDLEKNNIAKEANKQERKQMRKASFKQGKGKTAVKIIGLSAINPVNHKEIPIFISDYVFPNESIKAAMSVPAHDQRDYEFAKEYCTEVIQVVEGGDVAKSAYTGDGIHINSDFLNGLSNAEASREIIYYLEKNRFGQAKTIYKLRDWVFSRQRFWGEPVPLVNCKEHGWVAVPEETLPVMLPLVESYEPTDTGESPLAKIREWVETICPICGAPAMRETDTMPGWAGSSWYWLRFMDPKNDKEFANFDVMKYWGKVDLYDGGMEHAARHLLYARFWNHFLYKQGLVPNKEPINIRVAHGLILGAGGVKMSKSLGNVVNPDKIVNQYGADALRLYIMFLGNYSESVNWQEDGVKSCKKFINRVIRLSDKVKGTRHSKDLENFMHKTIKKVTDDINTMKFNTAISAMHQLTSEFEKQENVSKNDYRILLLLLHPFIPHITEELNEKLKLGSVLAQSKWPKYDAQKLMENGIKIPVQINGKLKGFITTSKDENQETIKSKALADITLSKFLGRKSVIRVIVVKDKIVNIIAQ